LHYPVAHRQAPCLSFAFLSSLNVTLGNDAKCPPKQVGYFIQRCEIVGSRYDEILGSPACTPTSRHSLRWTAKKNRYERPRQGSIANRIPLRDFHGQATATPGRPNPAGPNATQKTGRRAGPRPDPTANPAGFACFHPLSPALPSAPAFERSSAPPRPKRRTRVKSMPARAANVTTVAPFSGRSTLRHGLSRSLPLRLTQSATQSPRICP
jgi:hypothetical protein